MEKPEIKQIKNALVIYSVSLSIIKNLFDCWLSNELNLQSATQFSE
jgi:hypothetical protein